MDLRSYGSNGTQDARDLWEAFFRRLSEVARFATKSDWRIPYPP